jgi:ATP-dependent Lhr-like helicase
MIFVNSRRLAERLVAALNDTAGAEIAAAHHGSMSRDHRAAIEASLKAGELPCIVATSSLELGIDIGAVDLVIQVEAPPSIAAGLQRIGRAGHSVGALSRGRIFPKHRGDLLACVAARTGMLAADVEETFYPRNPLDVLAQQIVAITAMDPIHEDVLYELVRRAAPFAELPRSSFDGVLDMLSGKYPSDEFAELRPRIVWDRKTGILRGRKGAGRIAVVNAGTIPDRGLYGVFLNAAESSAGTGRRVGELDEEMVFEAREGEVFVLGASSWRITEITHDRVLVTPAPGQPGKMPFWRGDRVGRGAALGEAMGELAREIASKSENAAENYLRAQHSLDERAAKSLVRYIHEEQRVTGQVPSDRAIVIERFVDEVGDTRVCLLSPYGGRVFAPLATVLAERCRTELGIEIECVWSDDGIVLRFPGTEAIPEVRRLFPTADDVEDIVVRAVGGSALFAARFRECAGRALLLPRNSPGKRSPLWAQRKRARDLLSVASRYASFPILLETYREVLRDAFDLPTLKKILARIESREIIVHEIETRSPSPFAASLLFGYVGNFMYDLDMPLAERKAQRLAVDHARLRELLGEAELRELLDPASIGALEGSLQRTDGKRPVVHEDDVHDLLLSIGDLSLEELVHRAGKPLDAAMRKLVVGLVGECEKNGRIVEVTIAREKRFVAVEDAARYRDALGVRLPDGLPPALLEFAPEPLVGLVSRYARTHGPFRMNDVAHRFGVGIDPVRMVIRELVERGRLVEGEMLPGGSGTECCDLEVLRILKRRSLAKWFAEVEPVGPETYARFLLEWHGIMHPRRGTHGLLAVVEQLQGTPVFMSALENEILPARIEGYRMGDLDGLCAAGEVFWRGIERSSDGAGKIALYSSAAYPYLAPPPGRADGALAAKIRDVLERRGAVFFYDLLRETGGFAPDVVTALWDLIWAGEVTNDTLAPLRSLGAEQRQDKRRSAHRGRGPIRGAMGRRQVLPGTEGRFSLLPKDIERGPNETEKRAAVARSLLDRHGVLCRESVLAEGIPGGFSAVYDVLRAMEDAGKVRRGYFISDLGAAQFALPGAEDRLRALRETSNEALSVVLSAVDPASPWGAALRFPGDDSAETNRVGQKPKRALGARVVVRDGRILAWLGRTEKHLITFVQNRGIDAGAEMQEVAKALAKLVDEGRTRVVVISTIDGLPAARSPLAPALRDVGFVETIHGYAKRRALAPAIAPSLSGPRDGWARPWETPRESSPTLATDVLPDDDDFDDLLDD